MTKHQYQKQGQNSHKSCQISSGIINFFSRLISGVLFDKLGYRKLMTAIGLVLSINLVCIYYIGQHFIGLLICVWVVYFLGFAHFSTIPAQVAIRKSIEYRKKSHSRLTSCSQVSSHMSSSVVRVLLSPSHMEP